MEDPFFAFNGEPAAVVCTRGKPTLDILADLNILKLDFVRILHVGFGPCDCRF